MVLLGKELVFPPVEMASSEGILAFGGDLQPQRLMLAYQSGIFPWYNEGEPIIWYSPDMRMVLFPDELKISKSMRRFKAKNKGCQTQPSPDQCRLWRPCSVTTCQQAHSDSIILTP